MRNLTAPRCSLKRLKKYTLEFERIQSLDRLERNIEVLYRKGIAAGKSLLYHADLSDLRLLERLSEEQLRAVRRALPGISLTRDEVLTVVPDPKSFLEFALKWAAAPTLRSSQLSKSPTPAQAGQS